MSRQLSIMPGPLSRDLESISKDMRGLLMGDRFPYGKRYVEALFPKVNVSFNDEFYRIEIFLPGVNKDSLEVSLEGRHLSVSGSRDFAIPKEAAVLCNERFQGCFQRAFTLPQDADPDTVKATMENGLLRIEISRTQKKPTAIQID